MAATGASISIELGFESIVMLEPSIWISEDDALVFEMFRYGWAYVRCVRALHENVDFYNPRESELILASATKIVK